VFYWPPWRWRKPCPRPNLRRPAPPRPFQPPLTPRELPPLQRGDAPARALPRRTDAGRHRHPKGCGPQTGQAAGATLIPWSPAPDAGAPEADCDPIADKVVAPLIENAAKANALTVKLVRAVIEQESAFRPCAVSSKGAQGLMQLMPDTASKLSVKDVFDPQQNMKAAPNTSSNCSTSTRATISWR